MTEQQLKALPINPDEFVKKLHICFQLSEVQYLYVKEIERIMKQAGYYGFEDKYIINKAADATKRVMNLVRNVTDSQFSNKFEDSTDELKFLIDKFAGL